MSETSHTYYLDLATVDDIDQVENDLRSFLDSRLDTKGTKVTIQFTLDFETVLGIMGWVYNFWIFGKTFFFPDGKFRKPKLFELRRNFQIVTGVLALKNLLLGLWKDKKKTLDQIGTNLEKLTQNPAA